MLVLIFIKVLWIRVENGQEETKKSVDQEELTTLESFGQSSSLPLENPIFHGIKLLRELLEQILPSEVSLTYPTLPLQILVKIVGEQTLCSEQILERMT